MSAEGLGVTLRVTWEIFASQKLLFDPWHLDKQMTPAVLGPFFHERRRATKAQVPTPGLHDFRRAFALECLRNGMEVYSLQKLMGHADLQVLRRYLAQTTEDIAASHRVGSPVDNSQL